MSGSVTKLAFEIRQPKTRNDAAGKIWNLYCRQLLSLARKHLSQGIRRREDEEDVLQNAYCSFYRRLEAGQFELNSRTEIWSLLAKITVTKARKLAARHLRDKRDVRQEVSDARAAGDDRTTGDILGQLRTAEPSPVQVAEFAETLKHLLAALPNETIRSVVLLKLEGYKNEEIATRLGCTVRTVERKLEAIREVARGVV